MANKQTLTLKLFPKYKHQKGLRHQNNLTTGTTLEQSIKTKTIDVIQEKEVMEERFNFEPTDIFDNQRALNSIDSSNS
jgi:hypothetical protein